MSDCEHLNPGPPPKDPTEQEYFEWLMQQVRYIECLAKKNPLDARVQAVYLGAFLTSHPS